MSLSDQKRFLKRFEEGLARSSSVYRKTQADRQHHTFVVSSAALTRGIRDTLARELAGNKDAKKIISSILSALKKDIDNTVKTIGARTRTRIENNSIIVGKVLKDTNTQFVAWFSATQDERGEFRNIFKQVYRSYDKILDEFAKRISSVSEQIAGKSFGDKARNYFNLEHGEFQGVAESLAKDALIDALAETSSIEERDVLNWLKQSNIDTRIIRDGKTDRMFVFIGSKFGNLEEAFATKSRSKNLKDLVRDARRQVEENGIRILNLPGSDSFVDLKRKKLLKKVASEFKKVKGVKVVIAENLKSRASKTSVETENSRKSSGTAGALTKGRAAPRRKRRVKKGVASSPLQLIALINKKLPETVAKNMVPPRLQYQSGRFASSVRVTDVATTAKGFPSFGYTYQKFPYQTFEPGYAQGSVERDPRTLIASSIREIAAELAIGRFYTRRV